MTETRRDAYIPARLSDLIAALRAEGRLDSSAQQGFEAVSGLIAAFFHYESFAALQKLKDLYFPLDPDKPAPDGVRAADALAPFEEALAPVLAAANFSDTPFEVAEHGRAELLNDLRVKTSDVGLARVRYYGRGAHMEKVTRRSFFGLRRERMDAEVLDDVILLVAFKDLAEIDRQDRKALKVLRRVRPGSVLVKHFRAMPRHELAALHPGAAPAMKRRDQVFLSVPALAGGVPLLMQIGPALSVIFAVLAAYFGAGGVIEDSALKKALAAASGVIALGAFVMRQWMKYERQTLKYQKKLADTVYFRNVANNAGVLYGLVGAAEEQDVKEAALAYWMLLASGPLTKEALDTQVEALLHTRIGQHIDFEIHDALIKLERLRLVERTGETLTAAPPAEALKRLDEAWDGLFKYTASAPA